MVGNLVVNAYMDFIQSRAPLHNEYLRVSKQMKDLCEVEYTQSVSQRAKRALMFSDRNEALAYLDRILQQDHAISPHITCYVMGIDNNGVVDISLHESITCVRESVISSLYEACQKMNAQEYVFLEYCPKKSDEMGHIIQKDADGFPETQYPSATIISDHDCDQIKQIVYEQREIKIQELISKRDSIYGQLSDPINMTSNGVEYTLRCLDPGPEEDDIGVCIQANLPGIAMEYFYDVDYDSGMPRLYLYDDYKAHDRINRFAAEVDYAMDEYKKHIERYTKNTDRDEKSRQATMNLMSKVGKSVVVQQPISMEQKLFDHFSKGGGPIDLQNKTQMVEAGKRGDCMYVLLKCEQYDSTPYYCGYVGIPENHQASKLGNAIDEVGDRYLPGGVSYDDGPGIYKYPIPTSESIRWVGFDTFMKGVDFNDCMAGIRSMIDEGIPEAIELAEREQSEHETKADYDKDYNKEMDDIEFDW